MMKTLLTELNACLNAKEWAANKSWKEIYETCHRGDWLLWLFKRTNPDDLQLLTLAKAHCANTVRHLMKDKTSVDAVDAAIKFGIGEITREELNAYAAADVVTYAAAYTANAAANAAAYAAYTAAYAADYVAANVVADAAANAAANAALKENQLLTANICRQYLPIEKWNIK